jgi:putative ATPase
MDLFDASEAPKKHAPLPERLRPTRLDEVVGQDHLLGEGAPLRMAIEADGLSSLILWGPPGTGKTTLARLVAKTTGAAFVALSAVNAGVKDLKDASAEAAERLKFHGQRTILFVDEIHRFNKAQQDALLPSVEDGTLVLIGTTTENPSFEINAALLSRARVLVLKPLDEAALTELMQRALADERGLAGYQAQATPETLGYLALQAGGDARKALGYLELVVQATKPHTDGKRLLELKKAEEVVQRRSLLYDKGGDQHYDLISALHKSVRSSDPDAAGYWCMRMLEAGEDPLFVCRRLARMASEDIGNADPHALPLVMAAKESYDFLGSPEGELAILQAALYLACAPKSNSAEKAINALREEIAATGALPVPLHIRNAATRLMKDLDYGKGYQYAHDFEDAVVTQPHLPPGLKATHFYEPEDRGHEAEIRRHLARMTELRKTKGAVRKKQ